ncbi:hypothetical protein GBAR_LOCUS21308 [Geodia barretti]|uniref:Uncharacterized protein n=1 Tax=Geodia barretti TaxID=519541 RepID=A0AA35T0R7_GEOBA|nr:hypothetical protein GBAR_LOCUS21308 [Geodia barretti]
MLQVVCVAPAHTETYPQKVGSDGHLDCVNYCLSHQVRCFRLYNKVAPPPEHQLQQRCWRPECCIM